MKQEPLRLGRQRKRPIPRQPFEYPECVTAYVADKEYVPHWNKEQAQRLLQDGQLTTKQFAS